MTLPIVVGFNGPPQSGKDTVGFALREALHTQEISAVAIALAKPMRVACMRLLGLDSVDDGLYAAHKAIPQKLFKGETLRQAMIRYSEEFVKPNYGQDFWARALWELELHKHFRVTIITDIGFSAEADFLKSNSRFLLVQLHRGDLDFSNDSRSYLNADDYQSMRQHNDLCPLDAAHDIFKELQRLEWI